MTEFWTPCRLTLQFGSAQTFNSAFTDKLPFELGERRQDLEMEFARSGAKVKIVADTDKSHIFVQQFLRVQNQFRAGTCPAIQFEDSNRLPDPFKAGGMIRRSSEMTIWL